MDISQLPSPQGESAEDGQPVSPQGEIADDGQEPSLHGPPPRKRQRIQACPVERVVSESSGDEDDHNIENNPQLRPVRLRRKKFVRRRDRAVNSLETALDSRNYTPVPPRTGPHEIHHIKITADRQRGRPARDLQWTTKPPPTRRRGPEDIMTKAGVFISV